MIVSSGMPHVMKNMMVFKNYRPGKQSLKLNINGYRRYVVQPYTIRQQGISVYLY